MNLQAKEEENDCIILLLTVITLGIMLCKFSSFTRKPTMRKEIVCRRKFMSHRNNRQLFHAIFTKLHFCSTE